MTKKCTCCKVHTIPPIGKKNARNMITVNEIVFDKKLKQWFEAIKK